jgi:hypothetical protein
LDGALVNRTPLVFAWFDARAVPATRGLGICDKHVLTGTLSTQRCDARAHVSHRLAQSACGFSETGATRLSQPLRLRRPVASLCASESDRDQVSRTLRPGSNMGQKKCLVAVLRCLNAIKGAVLQSSLCKRTSFVPHAPTKAERSRCRYSAHARGAGTSKSHPLASRENRCKVCYVRFPCYRGKIP